MNEILFGGEKIAVESRVSRRGRTIRITLQKNGRVILTRPLFVPERRAFNFLEHRMMWVMKHLNAYKKLTPIIPHYGKREVTAHKASLLEKVLERLMYFNGQYGFVYNKVSIRDTKSRWGSCSRKGNLQFSFKMKYIADHLFDYIIVHELCHLKEFNHRAAFWNLVEKTIPDHKARRNELRKVI